mgnify:CR=1 FL=1
MKKQLITWALLVVLLLTGVSTIFMHGTYYFHKDYPSTPQFNEWLQEEEDRLADALLPRMSVEDIKKEIRVSKRDIEHYQRYYGSKEEQLQSVDERYGEKIEQVAGDPTYVTEEERKEKVVQLTKERDAKKEAIVRNFDDPTYVEEKIKEARAEAIVGHLQEKKLNAEEQLADGFYYEMKNVQTNETWSNGNPSPRDPEKVMSETFRAERPFKVQPLVIDLFDVSLEPFYEPVEASRVFTVPARTYVGSYHVDFSQKGTVLYNKVNSYHKEQVTLFVLWGLSIIALLLLVFRRPLPFAKGTDVEQLFPVLRKIPIDIQALLAFLFAGMIQSRVTYNHLFAGWTYGVRDVVGEVFSFVWLMLLVIVTATFIWNIWMRRNEQFRYEEMFTYRIVQAFYEMFDHRAVGTQFFILGIGFFLAGIGFVIATNGLSYALFYLFLVIFFGLPILFLFLRRAGYLSKIFRATEKMARGELTEQLPVRGNNVIAQHANHLNHLQDGVRESLTEQARSERLKTELITNVSHDLRTPLTAIITYVDLLKNEDITEEERKKYIAVLDQKSERLKVLIEDLFDVSKMASGHAEMNYQVIDVVQLIQQALAERAEEIEQSSCDVRVELPEEPLMANVDGQKLWRVIDNLTTNALKYSLEGTRIYMILEDKGAAFEWSVKNVSKYELDQNVEELVERFKRADEARHSEGSGLGLAIATSIVDLHGGNLQLEVDGDLFKVVVRIPKA